MIRAPRDTVSYMICHESLTNTLNYVYEKVMNARTRWRGETKMGRRRRRVVRVLRKQLPKVFSCPKCGIDAVYITSKSRLQALVKCGNCRFEVEVPVSPTDQPVDLYCKFTDKFYEEGLP